MDNTDYKILSILKKDSRISYTKISKMINLSVPSTIKKIEKLVDRGIISRFTIDIEYKKLNDSIGAIILLEVHSNKENALMNYLKSENCIISYNKVIGKYNGVLHIRANNTEKLDNVIKNLKNYSDTCTCVVIDSKFF